MTPKKTSLVSAVCLSIAMASFFYFSIDFPFWSVIPFFGVYVFGFVADVISSERFFAKISREKNISVNEAVKKHEITPLVSKIFTYIESKTNIRIVQGVVEMVLGFLFWAMFSYAAEDFDFVMFGWVMMVFGIAHLVGFYSNLKQMRN